MKNKTCQLAGFILSINSRLKQLYMNKYDLLLKSIQRKCKDTETIEGVGIFKQLCIECNIKFNRIDLYLDILSSLNLIQYSLNKFITITDTGKNTITVFK